jgi:hypothetical protein
LLVAFSRSFLDHPTIFQEEQEAREEATCIIEEEFLHLESTTIIQNTDSAAEEIKAVEAMEAAPMIPGEATTVLDMEVERGPVLVPPPLLTLPDFSHAPLPFFHLEQLEFVFELQS